jgi:hypothetical protein
MAVQPSEGMEAKPKPNYRVHYQIIVGDLATSNETHDFYTSYGDDDAREKARLYVDEQDDGLTKTRLLKLERLVYTTKKVEVEETTPISL